MVKVENGEFVSYGYDEIDGEMPVRDAQEVYDGLHGHFGVEDSEIGSTDGGIDPIKALSYAGKSFASDRSDDMGPVAPDAMTLEKVRGFVADNAGKTALAGLGIATLWVLKKYYRNHHGHNQD